MAIHLSASRPTSRTGGAMLVSRTKFGGMTLWAWNTTKQRRSDLRRYTLGQMLFHNAKIPFEGLRFKGASASWTLEADPAFSLRKLRTRLGQMVKSSA